MGESSRALERTRQDQIEKVPFGWRWLIDAFDVIPRAGGFAQQLADMTQAKTALRLMRDARIPATMAHLIVRACALVLARNPQWHQMMATYRRLTPDSVDIGLSLAGRTTYAPVVVLPAVDQKPLSVLIPTIIEAIDRAVDKEAHDLEIMRKYFWLVPFAFLRRFITRCLGRSLWFRRRLVGTFQVSILPQVDAFAPFIFYTGSLLAAGAIRDRVVAIDGRPVVRPTMWLTLCAEHGAMDGARAAELVDAIKEMLESDELVREARDACETRRALGNGASEPTTIAPAAATARPDTPRASLAAATSPPSSEEHS